MLRTCDISFLVLLHCGVFFYKTTSGIRMHARGLEGKNQFPFYSIFYQRSCLDSTFCNSVLTAVYFITTVQWLATLCTQNSIRENFLCFHKTGIVYSGLPITKHRHRRKYKSRRNKARCIINTDISTRSCRSHIFVDRLEFINSDKNLWTIIISNNLMYWSDCVGSSSRPTAWYICKKLRQFLLFIIFLCKFVFSGATRFNFHESSSSQKLHRSFQAQNILGCIPDASMLAFSITANMRISEDTCFHEMYLVVRGNSYRKGYL
jgi:hypothetical protein